MTIFFTTNVYMEVDGRATQEAKAAYTKNTKKTFVQQPWGVGINLSGFYHFLSKPNLTNKKIAKTKDFLDSKLLFVDMLFFVFLVSSWLIVLIFYF